MTLGQQIIRELGDRGLRGFYFDYEGYQELKDIDARDDLEAFFIDQGFEDVESSSNIGTIVDSLEFEATDSDRQHVAWDLVTEGAFLALLGILG
jgi:hypothetical protein